MAAVLSTSGNVTISTTGETLASMHVEVRSNIATLRDPRSRSIIEQRDQVTSVGPLRGATRVVTFADGTTWTVAATRRPCGCGR